MTDSEGRTAARPESQHAVNRLLSITRHSLASYLLASPPWEGQGAEPLAEAARHVAEEHQRQAARIGRLLVSRHGYADSGQFPSQFARYNDLALGYLASRLIEHESLMIDELARWVERLAGDAEAQQLAEEVLAGERRHLDLLTRLAPQATLGAHGTAPRAIAGSPTPAPTKGA